MNRDERIKRLKIRCWRRGTKEMDLILGGYIDAHIQSISAESIEKLERLLEENDIEIYRWILGETPPEDHRHLIETLRANLN